MTISSVIQVMFRMLPQELKGCSVCIIDGFMNCAVEMGSGGIMYTPSLGHY
jgi:hypothetical protein